MLGKFYQSKTRQALAKSLRSQLGYHLGELKQARIRPPFLIDTLETGLKEEPLFAKVETEKSFYSRIYEFQKKEPEATINEEESWKIWRKWALKCNDRLKFSSKEFAKMVVESGAHDHNSFNRQQLSHVFENTYHAALACRIGGALTLCTSHIERMSAMECDLETVVHQAVSDAKALCVEKYVVSPLVEVQFSDKKGAIKEKQFVRDKLVWPIVAVESQIRFVVVEALKNAAKSLIKKYGILGIEDRAPPVSVLVEQCGNKTMITIADEGIGIDPAEVEKCMSCFYTSYNVPLKADATVSDAFGTPFAGVGFGLTRLKIYTEFHGGSFRLITNGSGNGATVSIKL